MKKKEPEIDEGVVLEPTFMDLEDEIEDDPCSYDENDEEAWWAAAMEDAVSNKS